MKHAIESRRGRCTAVPISSFVSIPRNIAARDAAGIALDDTASLPLPDEPDEGLLENFRRIIIATGALVEAMLTVSQYQSLAFFLCISYAVMYFNLKILKTNRRQICSVRSPAH